LKKSGQEFFFQSNRTVLQEHGDLYCGRHSWVRVLDQLVGAGATNRIRAAAAGFVFIPLALDSAWYLEGRPPVTNLYSSANLHWLGAVALGLIVGAHA